MLHVADAARLARDLFLAQQNAAAVRHDEAGEDVEKRAFPHAADAQQADQLILMQRQADILDDRGAIKAFCNVFCPQPVHFSASFPFTMGFVSSNNRW